MPGDTQGILAEIPGNFLTHFVDQPLSICNPITSLCVGVIHARKTVASVELFKELLNGKDLESSRFSNKWPPHDAAAGSSTYEEKQNGTGYRQMVQR